MIYVSDLSQLISQWTDRLRDSSYPPSYRDALFECCYELDSLVKKSIEEDLDSEEAFQKWMKEVHNAA